MEVCGGQTHSIIRNGIDQLLPEQVELIHGPGCPVCVTPLEMIDRALAIASTPGVIFCSFGDMLRVPGSGRDLFSVRAEGADVRIVYSPLDAVALAGEHPDHEVVFFAIGFETTAPANAMAALEAERRGLANFSMLVSHVLVPPAIEAILRSPSCRVQAFLAAGHVCTVMGTEQYGPLAREYRVPIVVTGFEPLDVLEGVRRAVHQLEAGTLRGRERLCQGGAPEQGNLPAQRGAGAASSSRPTAHGAASARYQRAAGACARRYARFDAEQRFDVGSILTAEARRVPQRRGAAGTDQAQRLRVLRHASARRARRWARRWSRVRAPAPPTTATAAFARARRPPALADRRRRWTPVHNCSTGHARRRCATTSG